MFWLGLKGGFILLFWWAFGVGKSCIFWLLGSGFIVFIVGLTVAHPGLGYCWSFRCVWLLLPFLPKMAFAVVFLGEVSLCWLFQVFESKLVTCSHFCIRLKVSIQAQHDLILSSFSLSPMGPLMRVGSTKSFHHLFEFVLNVVAMSAHVSPIEFSCSIPANGLPSLEDKVHILRTGSLTLIWWYTVHMLVKRELFFEGPLTNRRSFAPSHPPL